MPPHPALGRAKPDPRLVFPLARRARWGKTARWDFVVSLKHAIITFLISCEKSLFENSLTDLHAAIRSRYGIEKGVFRSFRGGPRRLLVHGFEEFFVRLGILDFIDQEFHAFYRREGT
jgi:hypothetical protein